MEQENTTQEQKRLESNGEGFLEKFKRYILVIILALGLLFVFQNLNSVNIRFAIWDFNVFLAIALIIAFAAGWLVGWLSGFSKR